MSRSTHDPVRHLPLVGLAVILLAALACEGDFPRPELDNPNDPANGGLPASPVIDSVRTRCAGDTPTMDLWWTINSEANITEYQVYRSASETVDPGELILHVPVGNTFVNDHDGIELDAVYYYRVRSVDVTGRVSLRSEPVAERAKASCP